MVLKDRWKTEVAPSEPQPPIAASEPTDKVFQSGMDSLHKNFNIIERNFTAISSLQQSVLKVIGRDEKQKHQTKLQSIYAKTDKLMEKCRLSLGAIAKDTKTQKGKSAMASAARKSQQSSAAKKLIAMATKYLAIQENCKLLLKERMGREIRLARPNASDSEIQHALENGSGLGLAQQLLSSKVGDQRRNLEEVNARQQDILQVEQSIEQLATLFQDMQQQETINVIEANVSTSASHIETGGKAISLAIDSRVKSRKKMWYVTAFALVVFLAVCISLYVYVVKPMMDKKQEAKST